MAQPNTRQTNFINNIGVHAKQLSDLVAILREELESFEEEFYTNQDNDLNKLEASTTVNINSSSGQPTLNVASTTNFETGEYVIIDEGGSREETKRILTIGANQLNFTENLAYVHTAADADDVVAVGPLKEKGLSYADIQTYYNQAIQRLINYWDDVAVATRECGKDVRRVMDNN